MSGGGSDAFGQESVPGKITRHGADEDKHGRSFDALLKKRGLTPVEVPGIGRAIQRTLRECALAEIRVHRDVSLAVMAHMGRVLGWSRARSVTLAAGIHAAQPTATRAWCLITASHAA